MGTPGQRALCEATSASEFNCVRCRVPHPAGCQRMAVALDGSHWVSFCAPCYHAWVQEGEPAPLAQGSLASTPRLHRLLEPAPKPAHSSPRPRPTPPPPEPVSQGQLAALARELDVARADKAAMSREAEQLGDELWAAQAEAIELKERNRLLEKRLAQMADGQTARPEAASSPGPVAELEGRVAGLEQELAERIELGEVRELLLAELRLRVEELEISHNP